MPMHPNFTKASATSICHIYTFYHLVVQHGVEQNCTVTVPIGTTFVTLKIIKK